jgi:hypothetical protein
VFSASIDAAPSAQTVQTVQTAQTGVQQTVQTGAQQTFQSVSTPGCTDSNDVCVLVSLFTLVFSQHL